MKKNLSDLQWAVMEVLWNHGASAASEVQERIQYEKQLARTTVTTVLSRLKDQGVVEVLPGGGPARFSARISRGEARRSMVDGLLDKAFSGDPAELVNHLLGRADISEEELERVKELLEQRRDRREHND